MSQHDLSPLTPADVQRALDALGRGIVVRHYAESTATSELAAQAIGCEVGQIAKSICLMLEDTRPILVVASGDQRLDMKKVAALHSLSAKRVRMANAEECVALYGYAPGGVPPLGHRHPPQAVWLDEKLRRYAIIYAAAGSAQTIFPVATDDLPLLNGGRWADVARDA
ncbi:MAG: YbaK/EbsC family protein [Anaerolineae bacterium]|nr:YbaK/EbsC family protein [Anaerolineae bacterium]MDW8172673.1 YbaK/EbsC family protein [Anaerolineae bacterium]